MSKTMAMVFAAGLVLAACSGGGGGGGATTGGGSNCQDVSSGADFHITMKGFAFNPSCLTAKNTQKLDLENDDNTQHTFTIDKASIDVVVDPGQQQELDAPGAALQPGTYVFYCRFHGHPDGTGMAGRITVE